MTSIFLLGITLSCSAAFIHGTGASFPFPLYTKWFAEFQKLNPEVKINYQAIGSGGGIRQLLAHTVDFGASDAPMTEEQTLHADILHIPSMVGGVVLTYNLPGIPSGLKLTPDIMADLFLGNMKRWNDPRLHAINPELHLPDLPVTIIHRSNGSGTTLILTEYLAKISCAWKKGVGAGPAVKWPVGLGGKGNESVTSLIKQSPGALGYIELSYAVMNNLTYASLANTENLFIAPTVASIHAAAKASEALMPDDLRLSLTNAPGKDSYPLSAFTYILIYRKMDGAKGQEMLHFFKWAITDGQNFASKLHYSPLPESIAVKTMKALGRVSIVW